MKLIDNCRCSWRLYSVQLAAVIAALGFAQATLLPMWQAELSPRTYAIANSVLATVLFLARLIRQDGPGTPDSEGLS
ncbi:TPA: hypothetical protein L6B33_24135 [Pseudomonas aeruginosa]|uniref:DUF7940 domain-containing protein n=1 Tax=Pseudomonas aeruginosa TaxID=287 RepID=UPI000936C137|nr:hypothetical protein [Pseudomonas aeruginosa]RCM51481.1 hypothetical protein PA82_03372 [Pseudomonas aeruginosa]HBP5712238.1 hypothetical protein [Pseudomonas aeruginosa]HCT4763201.1 hypothetical protein [Pseudomonas aeruginosa]HDZ6692569.1 hypothetical protein [Pseudomonas aeruginosa]